MITDIIDVSNLTTDEKITIAENRNSSPDALLTLASNDEPYLVRYFLAKNPSLPLKAIEILSKDSKDSVRMNLAKNPSTSRKVLDYLAYDDNFYVRRNVMNNANFKPLL